jgi:hypothetical protein
MRYQSLAGKKFGWHLIIAKFCWLDVSHQGWLGTNQTNLFFFILGIIVGFLLF